MEASWVAIWDGEKKNEKKNAPPCCCSSKRRAWVTFLEGEKKKKGITLPCCWSSWNLVGSPCNLIRKATKKLHYLAVKFVETCWSRKVIRKATKKLHYLAVKFVETCWPCEVIRKATKTLYYLAVKFVETCWVVLWAGKERMKKLHYPLLNVAETLYGCLVGWWDQDWEIKRSFTSSVKFSETCWVALWGGWKNNEESALPCCWLLWRLIGLPFGVVWNRMRKWLYFVSEVLEDLVSSHMTL